jgi:hypothetical protein
MKRNPDFYHCYVEFEDTTSAEQLLKDHWAFFYEHALIRILPSNINSDLYKQRTQYVYKLSGIPTSLNAHDLQPILEKLNFKTCTFQSFSNRQITKNAIVFSDKFYDTQDQIKINLQDCTLYITSTKVQTCTICGQAGHIFTSCSNKKTNNNNPNRYETNELKLSKEAFTLLNTISNIPRHIRNRYLPNKPKKTSPPSRNWNNKNVRQTNQQTPSQQFTPSNNPEIVNTSNVIMDETDNNSNNQLLNQDTNNAVDELITAASTN